MPQDCRAAAARRLEPAEVEYTGRERTQGGARGSCSRRRLLRARVLVPPTRRLGCQWPRSKVRAAAQGRERRKVHGAPAARGCARSAGQHAAPECPARRAQAPLAPLALLRRSPPRRPSRVYIWEPAAPPVRRDARNMAVERIAERARSGRERRARFLDRAALTGLRAGIMRAGQLQRSALFTAPGDLSLAAPA